MNILPKKKWHVRTKENIARVRRDEAKAAAEEQSRLDRVKLAEQEDRVNRMRRNAGVTVEDQFAQKSSDEPSTSSTGHVNFFAELEQQERTNLASGGNKQYQEEKKREKYEWESKMGIMKRFAEDTKELNKESSWWESIERIKPDEKPKELETTKKPSEKELRKKLKKQIKEEKKRKRQKRHRYSSSSSSDSDKKEAKRQKLELLRKERLERELAEQKRVRQLVGEGDKEQKTREPTYSNQFNPDFVRRR